MIPHIDREGLLRDASAAGFQPEALEKVYRLIALLEAIAAHPFLRNRLALKGGTALNLFFADVPRLSVDIDLNYIGAMARERMLQERPQLEQALSAVFGRLNLEPKSLPDEHAGRKYRLGYTSALGRPAVLELDMNYMFRTPLWPAVSMNSQTVGSGRVQNILSVDLHELAGGKLAALMARSAPRDLFDARLLLQHPDLDAVKLRLAFVVYGGVNRKDWRRVSIDDLNIHTEMVQQRLLPVLRADATDVGSDVARWAGDLLEDCKRLLGRVLPLQPNELEFLERLNGRGEIVPELLTEDTSLQHTLRNHPGLLWKARNVKQHRR